MFQPGDVVRLKTGMQPIVVTSVRASSGSIKGIYISPSELQTDYRSWDDYVPYDNMLEDHQQDRWDVLSRHYNHVPEPQGENLMSTLYETEDGRFGTKLATNSKGEIVLEIKGTGEVEAFAADKITEVVPYTVSVQFIEDNSGYGRSHKKNYSFISTEGAVSEGDLIFVEGSPNMARVVKVNTKSKQATKELKGRKVVTETI